MARLPSLPVPVQITALLRALDTGDRVERVWRSTQRIGPEGLLLAHELPLEPGRPVEVSFELPDDEVPFVLRAQVAQVAAAPGDRSALGDQDPERPRARGVRFVALDEASRERIDRYVRERMLLP